MRYIEGISRKSRIAFPEYIDDYITENNPVRVIDAFVNSLNLKDLGFKCESTSNAGRPGYNPADMLKLFLYGYMNKVNSSRKLEAEAGRNIELMWLLRKLSPDYRTIAGFRRQNKKAIQEVFRQLVLLCKKWKLFGMEVVAVDGSKFKACNSKKNNFNEKSLTRNLKYIDGKLQEYMSMIEQNDESEISSKAPDKKEIESRIKELTKRKEAYQSYQDRLKNENISQISTTDPDSKLMHVNNKGIDVCYNVQTVVDNKHKLIVDYDVINNPGDQNQLSTMSKKAKDVFEVDELKVLADKGYYDADEFKKCDNENIIAYVSKPAFSNFTGEKEFYIDKFKYNKEKNMYVCPVGCELKSIRTKPIDESTKFTAYANKKACNGCTCRDKCTSSKEGRIIKRPVHQDFLDIVDQRTIENKKLYKTRQMIVEHPFGTIKRSMGLSYFLTKTMESVKTEVSLAFLAYDMKRLINIVGTKEIIKRLAGKFPVTNILNLHNYTYWNLLNHRVAFV